MNQKASCVKTSCGFTLVELMVTVGVMLVLAAVAVPTVSTYYRLARQVDCQVSIVNYLRAQELYYVDNDTYYDRTGTGSYDTIGWSPTQRPDQPSRYRFPELGVEFRPDNHRGYRILVSNIQWSWLFWQQLQLELKTDEDFDHNGVDDYYIYQKYNRQSSFSTSWNTNGQWVTVNNFWFDISGCQKFSTCQ
jgi:prepilin-type N-terminal cleavage/methylation domain-containing protein